MFGIRWCDQIRVCRYDHIFFSDDLCGNFDIILGPFLTHSQLQPIPTYMTHHFLCTVVSLLGMLIGS